MWRKNIRILNPLTFCDVVTFAIHPADNMCADARDVLEDIAIRHRGEFLRGWVKIFRDYLTIVRQKKVVTLRRSDQPRRVHAKGHSRTYRSTLGI